MHTHARTHAQGYWGAHCRPMPCPRSYRRSAVPCAPQSLATFAPDAGAPPPPNPRALRVPLRRAVSVLAVTRCGMIAARLSRDDCLLQGRYEPPSPQCAPYGSHIKGMAALRSKAVSGRCYAAACIVCRLPLTVAPSGALPGSSVVSSLPLLDHRYRVFVCSALPRVSLLLRRCASRPLGARRN